MDVLKINDDDVHYIKQHHNSLTILEPLEVTIEMDRVHKNFMICKCWEGGVSSFFWIQIIRYVWTVVCFTCVVSLAYDRENIELHSLLRKLSYSLSLSIFPLFIFWLIFDVQSNGRRRSKSRGLGSIIKCLPYIWHVVQFEIWIPTSKHNPWFFSGSRMSYPRFTIKHLRKRFSRGLWYRPDINSMKIIVCN